MENYFNGILELRTLHEEEAKLNEKKLALITPLLKDVGYIPKIYEWFCEISGGLAEQDSMANKHKIEFLFIILVLYSPMTLIDGQLVNGIRGTLADVLGYKSPSAISNLLKKDLLFQYTHCKEHEKNIDYIYAKLQEYLEANNMILFNPKS